MLKLKATKSSSFTSDQSSSSNGSQENLSSDLPSSLSDINFIDSKFVMKPSAIYLHGIEIEIIDHVLMTKSKLDEHTEFVVKICKKNETWAISRRYNKFRELHQNWRKVYPILTRITFPVRKLMFSKSEKFLEERKIQLEHYLRCFLELLINEPKCSLNEIVANSTLSKEKLCKFCPFFQQTEDDLFIMKTNSIIKLKDRNGSLY